MKFCILKILTMKNVIPEGISHGDYFAEATGKRLHVYIPASITRVE